MLPALLFLLSTWAMLEYTAKIMRGYANAFIFGQNMLSTLSAFKVNTGSTQQPPDSPRSLRRIVLQPLPAHGTRPPYLAAD